ncbi:glycosyltransferase family 2 protein [Halomonas sp. McH1-25]|uniref:glycosyltransferase n=1 Tax=unclassified Halomonas TaxID=2609666 RepID=UPI001EF6952A|nr:MULTISPECIES: glycosyltransferase [unclassified Halomonas]MCG7600323.1 glycosyltransferase family 2 protein [Halomonas sp. McH1-25]MCP1342499.1 glycosyltransferase family 2 protein [Halomonas sp. FL8]MCP1359564.1 glycosyltransferase family 2 protein [Halomonas sp. BBD45]
MQNFQSEASKASWVTELTTFLFGAALLTILVFELPAEVFSPESKSFILAIGFIGAWRYSWWFVQAIRSVWYNRKVFPKLRAQADAVAAVEKPDHLYILCTSFRIEPEVSFAVYDALVRDVHAYGVPTTIFAAISDRSDVDIIDHVMAENGWPGNVEISYMFQKGDGKRSAMAEVLRAISRRLPSHRSLLVSMDGDIQIEPGTLEHSLSFFLANDELGALTTNNRAIVNGGDVTKEWYDLRYAQRHLVMSSMSVSERLLVLTGRYSAFRAELATDPGFIDLVENDHVEHWRFGNFKFLSGDDKSTWYWLIKNNWKMLYIPDVYVSGFEELPDRDRFFKSSIDLMRRWFGNMLRTSGRAIGLGPRSMGFFTWWSLVDQRLSMWTTLIGPSVAIMLTLFVRPSFIFAYALWIIFTRSIATTVLALQRGRFSLLWVPLLYYNQVGGALLKTYVSFRFNRQKWSRQGISAGEPDDPKAVRRQRMMGHFMHGVYYGGMLMVLIIAVGVLAPPDRLSMAAWKDESELWGDAQNASENDSYWIALSLADVPAGDSVQLPAEDLMLDATLNEELSKLDAIHATRMNGYDANMSTVLLVAPDLADKLRNAEQRPLSEVQQMTCTQDNACTLMTQQGPIVLTDMEVRLRSAQA